MIRLITGTPGSGKTLWTVTRLIEEIEKNPERMIYCDIKGLKIDGVLPPPDDWRETPEGSLIIYDECQYRPMFQRERGKTKYRAILDLTMHRHTGRDIWLITQSAVFLHTDLLLVVGEHFHLDRPYGAALANVSKFREAQKNPMGRTAQSQVESKSLFKYNKDIFKYYDSVDVDEDKANHKKLRIPFSMLKYFIFGGLIIIWALRSLYMSIFANIDVDTLDTVQEQKSDAILSSNQTDISKDETNTQKNPAHAHHGDTGQSLLQDTALDSTPSTIDTHALHKKYLQPYTYEVAHDDVVRPALVAQMGNDCKAYNQYGDLLNIDDKLCKSMLKEYGTKPRARRIFNEYQAQNSQLNATEPSISPTQADKAVLPSSQETIKVDGNL